MTSPARAEFRMLGPLRVLLDGVEVPIATRRQRALLVLLLMNVGRVVPAERLIDQLWDGSPPPQAAVTLRSYVSNVRQALGGTSGFGAALVTRGQGYCLDVPADSVDTVRLEAAARRGHDLVREERFPAALEAFDTAVAVWGGDPLTDVADHAAVQSTVTQLTETYLGAVEGRFEALLALGRHAEALPGLEAFAADHPLREGPRMLLMLALYRAGRSAEALAAHRAFRVLLRDELGIDPSSRLDRLQRRILDGDPALAVAPAGQPDVRPEPASLVVGRTREVSFVNARLDELAATGSGALLTVAGEPGIGKTTMLEVVERQARHRGMAVHTGRSPAASGAPAFWPWSQVIDSIAAGLDDDELRRAATGAARPVAQLSATVADRAGLPAPMVGDNPQALRFLLYDAVSTFLRNTARERPTVILLDDVHWADLPSLELLSYLTPALAGQPVLIVAAYRDLPAERTDALDATLATVAREDVTHELVLTGLRPADISELVHALFGADERAEPLAVLLHERTGGNPFFVRQLARLLRDTTGDGDGGGADSGWVGAVSVPAPRSVHHVVARRLAALTGPARDLLAAAAVVGRDFDLRLAAVAAAMRPDEALDAFDEAARHGLVETRTDSTRRFVHALVQEVVLDQLPAGRVARLHAAVAARLEQTGGAGPAELARHLWAARDLVGAAAVPALLAAADAATSVLALEETEMYLRRALHLVRDTKDSEPSTELAVLLGLFQLIVTTRGWGDAEVRGVVDRAMQLAAAGAFTDGTARLWWSMFFFLLDRDDPAYVQVAQRLLTAVAEADRNGESGIGHASRAAVHLTAVFSALDAGDRAAAHTHLTTARGHVEAAPAADLAAFDEHLHVMLLLIEGYWAALAGDAATHRATTDAAVALADADGRPFPRAVARTLAAASGPYTADPAYVHELAGQALDLAHRFGFGWLATIAACVQGWAGAHLGAATAEAAATIESHLADIMAHGRRGNESIQRMMLADVYALDGRTGQARAMLRQARQHPGPYRALVTDLVDERLRALGTTP